MPVSSRPNLLLTAAVLLSLAASGSAGDKPSSGAKPVKPEGNPKPPRALVITNVQVNVVTDVNVTTGARSSDAPSRNRPDGGKPGKRKAQPESSDDETIASSQAKKRKKDNARRAPSQANVPRSEEASSAPVTVVTNVTVNVSTTVNIETSRSDPRAGGRPTSPRRENGAAANVGDRRDDLQLNLQLTRLVIEDGITVELEATLPNEQRAQEAASMISRQRDVWRGRLVLLPLVLPMTPNSAEALLATINGIQATADGASLIVSASLPKSLIPAARDIARSAMQFRGSNSSP